MNILLKEQNLGSITPKLISLPDIPATTTANGRIYHSPVGDLPSITTVLSLLSRDSIERWRKSIGEEKADKITKSAGVFGSTIHNMCETYLRTGNYTAPTPLHMETFLNLKKSLDNHLTDIYGLELPLYSKYLGVAGRTDCIGLWNGKLCVIDFKTANKYKEKDLIFSYYLQATAYCIMFEERTGKPITNFVICISSQEGTLQLIEGKRDDYNIPLLTTIKDYYNEKGLTHPFPRIFANIPTKS